MNLPDFPSASYDAWKLASPGSDADERHADWIEERHLEAYDAAVKALEAFDLGETETDRLAMEIADAVVTRLEGP